MIRSSAADGVELTPTAGAPRVATSDALELLEIDEYGAPVTFAPARWLVCFVPGLRRQFWHRLVHRTHKHVLMLKQNADDTWTLFEPWWSRLLVRTIRTDQAVRYLRWAAMGDALLVEEDVPGRGSQFRGWSNCASLAAFVLGRPYWVWSPNALFRRLRAEDGVQQVDVPALLGRVAEATLHASQITRLQTTPASGPVAGPEDPAPRYRSP